MVAGLQVQSLVLFPVQPHRQLSSLPHMDQQARLSTLPPLVHAHLLADLARECEEGIAAVLPWALLGWRRRHAAGGG